MTPTASTTPVRERILATAFDLFYRQGYRATGINQVIAESGVAKASFYDHFPSKEDLLVAYVREMARLDISEARKAVEAQKAARDRFFAPIQSLRPWFEASGFRGCPFQNIVAEVPVSDPRVREAARQHRENVRALLRELTLDLKRATPAMEHLDPGPIADRYLLLMEGTIAMSATYQNAWPLDEAIAALEKLIE